jgi:hypothetical protein
MWSENHDASLRLLKSKDFKEESMTKVELYTLDTSTPLESNKSLVRIQSAEHRYPCGFSLSPFPSACISALAYEHHRRAAPGTAARPVAYFANSNVFTQTPGEPVACCIWGRMR